MIKIEKSSPDLENEVIFADKCAHCGACGAFCHHVSYNAEGIPQFDMECQETVGLCYNSCPRTDLPLDLYDKELFGQNRVDMALGVYKDIISVKPKKADSVILGLIEAGFSKGTLDAMVLPKVASEKPRNNVPIVIKSAGDAKGNIPDKSLHLTGPLCPGVGQAYHDSACKIGFLGNPCHITGLTKVMLSSFRTGADMVALKIGFMCASGGLTGCKYCVDFTAEHSDLTVGTMGAESGETLVIIRNQAGADALNMAIDAGLIEIANKNPDLAKLKKLNNNKKKKNLKTLLGKDMAKIHYLGLGLDQMKYFMSD